jgi:BRCA1-associated protein
MIVCILAIPNDISLHALCQSCGLANVATSILSAHRVIVPQTNQNALVIKFADETQAQQFYQACHGVVYDQATQERCIALFCSSVHFVPPSPELPSPDLSPPAGHYVLPTCPCCLERLDASVCGVIVPQPSTWPSILCDICYTIRQRADNIIVRCDVCGSQGSQSNALWMCLICGYLGCGRYQKSHGVAHFESTHHRFTIDADTHVVWDYVGDGFVHRLLRGSGYDAYLDATDEDTLDTSYSADHDTSCSSRYNEGCSALSNTTETIDEALLQQEEELLNGKLQSIASHYTELLNNQLQEQYSYFETKIANVDKELSDRLAELKAERSEIGKQDLTLQQQLVVVEKLVKGLERKRHTAQSKLRKQREELAFTRDLNDTIKQDDRVAASQTATNALQAQHKKRLEQMVASKQAEMQRLQQKLEDYMLKLSAQSDTTPTNPRQ